MTTAPTLSIVTCERGGSAENLRATVESVRESTDTAWEMRVVVDGARRAESDAWLADLSAADRRVHVDRCALGSGPVAMMNHGMVRATGEFVALLDDGDLLHPDALAIVRATIASAPDVDYLYTDEDEIDDSGRHFNAFLKPGWSPDRMRCEMYTRQLSVFRASVVEAVGMMRAEYEGAHVFDLALRVTERARHVAHVPHVLYHRRAVAIGAEGDESGAAHTVVRARRALDDHYERTGFAATAEADPIAPDTLVRPRPRLTSTPLVSIVIPTGGQRKVIGDQIRNLVVECVRSIVGRTTYPAFEIVCVTSDGFDDGTRRRLTSLDDPRLRFVAGREPFNFSHAVNRGVAASHGEHVILLNDDTEILDPDWIERLLLFSLDPQVGAVGAKLLYPDGRLQHVGVVTNELGPVHAFGGWPGESTGYFHNAAVAGNWSAVTAACLMTRRDCFEQVGGFTAALPLNYNDVDYCLKLRRAGYRIACNPAVRLIHFESSTRAPVVLAHEQAAMHRRWGASMFTDPYYSRDFLPGADFAVPMPDRPRVAVEGRTGAF